MLNLLSILLSLHSLADPTFGPEVEFRGKKQIPSLLCGAAVYQSTTETIKNSSKKIGLASTLVAPVGIAKIVYSDQKNHNETDSIDLGLNTLLGLGVTSGSIAGAGFLYSIKCDDIRLAAEKSYDTKLVAELESLCTNNRCKLTKVEEVKDIGKHEDVVYHDYTIKYPDGFEVHFTHDNSVIEVKTTPLTAKNAKIQTERLQTDVWDMLKKIGLTPPRFDGPWNGGHIHIGLDSAFKNLGHFKSFLNDLLEHPELAEGILGNDQLEAASPSKNNGARIRDLLDSLQEIPDHEKVTHENVRKLLYKKLPKDGFGIVYHPFLRTIELRFIRSQKSASVLEKIIRLIDQRIKYLAESPSIKPITDISFRPKSDSEKIRDFQRYIEETGLSWDEYEELVPTKKARWIGNFNAKCSLFFQKFAEH
ncbi:MAG: hypothetical protein M9962_06285 [Oligoflexia bacterium]|nr:hypothetical protein [Oligoflexia bacterium]